VKALAELPDDAKDFTVDPYTGAIHATVETKVKNDPKFYEGLNQENMPKDFLKKIEQEQYGRAANIVRGNMLKATGLSEKDFEALGEEGKKIDVFTPAFVKKLSEGKVTDKELQSKLIEANTKIQELESSLPELEKKYQGKYETDLATEKFDFIVLANLAQVPGLKAPAQYISDKIATKLRAAYDFKVIGTDAELLQKGKDLKVLVDNGTKVLSLPMAIRMILEADDLIEKKQGSQMSTGSTTVTTEEGKGLKMSSHVSGKVAKRIAEDEKASGGAK
jgi:hypothetical protein